MLATVTRQQLNSGEWETIRVEQKEVDQQYYENVVEAIPFFKRLGGTEAIERVKGVTRLISTRPDGLARTIWEFTE